MRSPRKFCKTKSTNGIFFHDFKHQIDLTLVYSGIYLTNILADCVFNTINVELYEVNCFKKLKLINLDNYFQITFN